MLKPELTNELINLEDVRAERPTAHNRVTFQVFLVSHAVDQIIVFLLVFLHRSAHGVQETLEAYRRCLETNKKKAFLKTTFIFVFATN